MTSRAGGIVSSVNYASSPTYVELSAHLVTAAVNTAGDRLTLTFSEAVTFGSGGTAGVAISGSHFVSYLSGSTTTALVYAIFPVVQSDETITTSYTQPGNGIETVSDGTDIATFSGFPTTNGSSIGLSISGNWPTSYRRGSSGSLSVTGASTTPTTANTVLTLGGRALTITSITGSDPYTINYTVPSGIQLKHDETTGYPVSVTVGSQSLNDTTSRFLLAPAGWAYFSTNSTAADLSHSSSVFYESNPADQAAQRNRLIGGQYVYQTTTSPSNTQILAINTTGYVELALKPTVSQIVTGYLIESNGTVGSTYSYTISVENTQAGVLSSPTLTSIGTETYTGTVSCDQSSGTLYYLVSTNSTESATTIKAASFQTVSQSGTQTVNGSGLTASTAYYLHFVHTNTFGVNSNVSSVSFSTLAEDTTPDQFTFGDLTNVALSTQYQDIRQITGVTNGVTLTVTNGELTNNNGGSWSSSTTHVAGQTYVRATVTSSSSFNTQTSVITTVNGISDTFSVTTVAADLTPDQFLFTDVINASLSTQYQDIKQITGVSPGQPLIVTNGELSNDNGLTWLSSVTMVPGQTLVRATRQSSSSYDTQRFIVVTVNGVSDMFSVTTGSAPGSSNLPTVTNTPSFIDPVLF